MKVNMFMPKYMSNFKCIGSKCVDTCCAGWDINIDSDTYEKYLNSTGELHKLVSGKFTQNKQCDDFFNKGLMILKEEARCPFLNSELLCDTHGKLGEDKLCITCKSFPRVYNIVDDIYEKSALPSCEEVCNIAFLNKNKMEFIECEEEVDEDEIEIRRIIDTEAFEGSNSLLQYFWQIRINSINIMQNRNYSIYERLNILKGFYNKIMDLYNKEDFIGIEMLIDDYCEEEGRNNYLIKEIQLRESIDFYLNLMDDNFISNVKSNRLKLCIKEYINGIEKVKDKSIDINKFNDILRQIDSYSYIFENYLVNQIFKDLVPFNVADDFIHSVNKLINSYRIIRAYSLGIAINNENTITDKDIIRVMQSISKDIEHNKVFEILLQSSI